MTDRFDEDRLLAYALGLNDDPELRDALRYDEALRVRLRQIEAETSMLEEAVRASVPAPQEGWADLAEDRWDRLRPYISPKREAPRRGWLRLRVLAPAATVAVVLAVAVGITLQAGDWGFGGDSVGGDASTESTDDGGAAAPGVLSSGDVPADRQQADSFETVAVAAAGRLQDSRQTFTVLRTLKGSATGEVTLDVQPGGELPAGSLAVLFLRPVSDKAGESPRSDGGGEPTAGGHQYLFQGEQAEVQTLPAGTDPDGVTLP